MLTFSDEFDGSSLDGTKWATKMPYSLDWWNTEGSSDRTSDTGDAEWYVDNAHTVNNGVLSITAKKECIPDGRPEIDPAIYNIANLCYGNINSSCTENGPYSCIKFPYTSGMIASYPSFSQRYGYFETRMKLPVGAGMWPAFWLMPTADPQPASTPWPWTSVFWPPEIDIMENLGTPTDVFFHSHFSGDYPKPGSVSNKWYYGGFAEGDYSGPDFSTGFHTFGLDWAPTALTWYVDGAPRFSSPQNLPPGSLSPGKMFIIADLSIGAAESYPGPPDSSTVFPQSLGIDYIRVYQRTDVALSPTPTRTAATTFTVTPHPTPKHIVISQFRTRGPNGASDEFLELYNPTGAAVNIGGWLVMGSANNGTTSTRAIISPGKILQPGQHYLLVMSNYSGSVAPDQTYSPGFADNGGIALFNGSAIVDQVGMSTGSAYKEGVALSPLRSNQNRSYERRIGGASGNCMDANDNSTDFVVIIPSAPRNMASPAILCK